MSRYPRDNRRRRRLLLLSGEQSEAFPPAVGSTVHVLAHNRDEDERRAEEFFGACEGPGRGVLHLAADPPEGARTVPFPRPYLLLGRSEGCDLQLPDPQVSKRHALLQMFGRDLLCVDLASRTGTHWATGPKKSGWVDWGETIAVGPYSFHYGPWAAAEQTSQELQAPTIDRSYRPEDMPKASIEICNARGRSARRTVKQLRRLVTLVGWSRRCKVRLKHESVSRVHCAFVLTARGVWVIDLLGRGGTLVNGDVVQYAKLDEGDDVCVGEFHLRVCYGRSLRRRRVGGMSESFVLSLVDRFAAMQQQMFEQQHDQMLLLTQMFGAIHHSQHELIRDDLRRLHEITRELQQVQSELLRRQAGSPFESGAAAPRSGEPNVTDPIQHEQPPSATPQGGPPAKLPEFHDALRESAASISDEAEREAASIGSVDEGEAAANSQMDPAGRSEAASPPEAVPEKEAEFGDPPADDSGPAAEAENAEPPVAEETSPTEPAAEGPHAADGIESSIDAAGAEAGRSTPVDDHAWLQHRLRVLERERNSLWRKITRTLSGGGA